VTPAKILIVEDEVMLAKELARGLQKSGYEVVGRATTGQDAVRMAEETEPDLILMDIMLEGEMDGIRAAELMRSRLDTAIIYLTAHTATDVFERAKITEPYGYLTKPVSPQELGRTVEMALYKRQMDKKLKESEERLRSILDAWPEMVFLSNPKFKILWANKTAMEMNPDVLGQTCYEAYPGSNTPCSGCPIERSLQTRRPESNEIYQPTIFGGSHWEDFSIPLVDAEGTVVSVVTIARNITERWKAEQDLQASQDRYRTILKTAMDGFWLFDTEGRLLAVNDAYCEMTGYSRDKLIGMKISMLEAVETGEGVAEHIRKIMQEGYDRFETLQRRKDGNLIDVEVSVRFLQGEQGSFFAFVRDITDRKRAQRALAESEEELRLTLGATTDGIWKWNFRTNELAFSPNYYKMLGYEPDEFPGTFENWLDLLHSEDRAVALQVAEQYLQTKPDLYENQFRLRTKRGEYRWIRATARVVERDAEGESVRMIGNHEDITDRKNAEEALRASEQKYRSLFQDSRDAVYVSCREGRFIDVNQSFCELFGYDREELGTVEAAQLYVNPADRQTFQQTIEKKGSVKDFSLQLRRKDGEVFEALETASVRFSETGEILGYQGILRDVTERKTLERQLLQAQKMESIGTLAGGIAHDFNNILQVVLGYSDMLLSVRKPGSAEYDELRAILDAARDGSDLAKRILAFSRKLEVNTRPVDLTNELNRIRKTLTRLIPKMVKVDLVLEDDLKMVEADKSQIEQLLLNLAVNAHHAMPDGGSLTIQASNEIVNEENCKSRVGLEPGEYVLLSVTDTGSGMDKEVVQHIFEPFYTTKNPGEGTGLGLAMVYGIVKSHHGHIECHSEPGVGTTFKIYLPALVEETEPDTHLTAAMPAFGTETILLVDDEERVRKLGEMMLTRSGYHVLTAANGNEALEVFNRFKNRIALVVLDLIMPEMGGKQCLEELLKIDPEVRVLIASGYSGNRPTGDAPPSGGVDLIRKPYAAKEFLRMVRKVIDRT
jgi:two-component system cell cycle sensor histidine kinase/response regulator CckA